MRFSIVLITICFLFLGIQTSTFAQNTTCGPAEMANSTGFTGTTFFNYGSVAKIKNQKYLTSAAVGQTFVGYIENNENSTNLGFYARYLLPPFRVALNATQGDLLDRIQLVWAVDGLGPSPSEGFNIYRDGIFLATVGAGIRNYNDFNVIAGKAYIYTVSGLNAFGEGQQSEALGFQVPNGVVTGWVRTINDSPVPNALVTLTPMQGFSAKFGALDGATAMADPTNPFLPPNDGEWTLTFWMKSDSIMGNPSLISLAPGLYIRAIDDGIDVSYTSGGAAILSSVFPDTTANDWHHVALSYDNDGGIGRLYVDGVLNDQMSMNTIASVDTLSMGHNQGSGSWDGRLDEFRIYDTQLDELDFGDIMEGTASSTTPNLTHYWKMDEELGVKSYDIINRQILYFCGATFDKDMAPVRIAGRTNEEGYYRIESASYGTGTTFLAKAAKSFYLHRSLKLNSSEMDYATLPDFSITNKATIEVWVNNASAAGDQSVLSKQWDANEFRVYIQPNGLDNNIMIDVNGVSHNYGNLGTGFQHLAMTIDSLTGVINMYKNGLFAGTNTYSGVTGNWSDTTSLWYVGARKNGNSTSEHFNGLIDEVAVYDTTLSQAAILSHFESSRDMLEPGLRVYFPFDEGNGNRLSNAGSVFLDFGTVVGAEWSTFAPNQTTEPHIFTPKTRQVTLNPSVTSVDQVDFTDRSTVAVSGYVRYKNTDCFAPNVEILVNGTSFSPKIFTDSLGKFVIDFDPGATAKLEPKFEDHVFIPAFWDVTNVNSPIAGIIFNDITTRKVNGQVAGGFCKKSIIRAPAGDAQNQGTVCIVEVRSVDGCLIRSISIDNQDGEFEFLNLPPLERMTVAVVQHSDTKIKEAFQIQGGSTVDLTKADTIIDFIYFAPPEVEITSGLESVPGCNPDVIVLDKGDLVTLNLKVKETYISTPSDDGICYLDTAKIQVINGFADNTIDTFISGGNLEYEFRVGNPNPSPPYLKTLQVIATSIPAGRIGSLVKQAIVTGTLNKLQTFTTMMPFMPSVILRDPPGDGSSSYIEKTEKVCKTTEMSMEVEAGIGGSVDIEIAPTINFVVAPFGLGKIVTVDPDFQFNIETEVTYKKVTSNSFQTCVSFNNKISTSDADLVVGSEQGGDLYVGEAINILFGFADKVTFDSCTVNVQEIVEVQPGNFATTFVYSEFNIKNNVLRYLEALSDSVGVDSTERASYLESIDRWEAILARNDTLKEEANFIRNISFDAGVEYEYSETSDTTSNSSDQNGGNTNSKVGTTFGFSFDNIGTKFKVNAIVKSSNNQKTENGNERGLTVGYTLKDDDPGDAFTVDVAMDSVYKTPVFRLRAGQSSCPWEPGTANREGPNLQIAPNADGTSAFTAVNVPANESAVFKFFLGNLSATNEDWTYGFTAIAGSNPDGAIIKLNGQPLNNNTIQYIVPYGQSIPITLTVDRGPVAYEYNDLKVALVSECQMARNFALSLPLDGDSMFFSSINLGVDFIRPCSEVNINNPEQNWVVLNDDPLQPGTLRTITVSGYDMNSPDFQLIRVQYRRSDGNGAWINLPTPPNLSHEAYNPKWSGFNIIPNSPDTLLLQPNFTQFVWETAGIEDGNYEFHAWAVCSGDASEKPGFSDIIKGKIDRQPPALLGIPQPSDGVYHVGDEISFTFNQNVNCNNNKLIQADLSQPNNVGLYNSTTNQLINASITCKDNKIIIDPIFQNQEFENKILRAELHNIEDLVGNNMVEEIWEFYVDRNELAWLTDSIQLTKYDDETKTITAKIHNRGGYPVPYTMQNIPDWVHVSPNAGTLVANEIEEIHFTVDETVPLGWFSDSIIMHTETGINPFFMGGDEVLNMAARVICRPDNWIINPEDFDPSNYSFSMNFTLALNIEGVTSVDKQDLVGAYVNGQLRGVARLQYNPQLDNYLAFLTAYSNVASGETVEFQIWDASECKLFALILESFAFNTDHIIGSPLVPQVIHTDGKVLRKIFIHPGWNWISMNLNLVDPEINGALSSLTNPGGGFIKDQDSLSGYSLVQQLWIGTLDTISPLDMYQYNSLAYDSISIIGTLLDPSTPIPVVSGWNWIGYIPNEKLTTAEALSSLTPTDGDIVKSQISFAQYVTGFGWIGNLKFFDAPNGYLLKLANQDTIIYPDPQNVRGQTTSGNRLTPPGGNGITLVDNKEEGGMPFNYWQVDPTQFEHNMNAIAIVKTHESNSNILKAGDEVGAFVNGEVRGSSQVTYIPSMDAYMIFMTIYANKEGELLTFKFYDASENKVFEIEESTGFVINSILGEVDNPEPLHLAMASGLSYEEGLNGKMSVYPNPFASSVFVRYYAGAASEDQLVITDVLSRVVARMDVQVKQGLNIVEWRPNSDVQPGTYFITLKNDEGSQMQKVLYIK